LTEGDWDEGVAKFYPNTESHPKLRASSGQPYGKTSLACFSSCNTQTEQQPPTNTLKSLIPQTLVLSSITTRRAMISQMLFLGSPVEHSYQGFSKSFADPNIHDKHA